MRISDWSSDVCSSDLFLGIRVRLVAGVDDRAAPGGGAGDALPDVLGPLGDGVRRTARCLDDLPGAHHDLPSHQERDQDVGQSAELTCATDQVVLGSEEHTSELQSLMRSSYAVFCLKKKILTTKKLWIATDLSRDRLCDEDCVFGTLSFL